MNLKFERSKLKRELSRSGKTYSFLREDKDDFGEPTGKSTEVCSIKAIYHESNGYIRTQTGEAATYRTKKEPRLLCLYEDATSLVSGDYVLINGKRYNVTGVLNIQEWSIMADISLEVVDHGD